MYYDKDFKLQALQLSDEIGVKAAAEQLGIKYYTLADCEVSVKLVVSRLSSEAGIMCALPMKRIAKFWNWRLNFAKLNVLMKFSKRH